MMLCQKSSRNFTIWENRGTLLYGGFENGTRFPAPESTRENYPGGEFVGHNSTFADSGVAKIRYDVLRCLQGENEVFPVDNDKR